jgi:hypothetical protein
MLCGASLASMLIHSSVPASVPDPLPVPHPLLAPHAKQLLVCYYIERTAILSDRQVHEKA